MPSVRVGDRPIRQSGGGRVAAPVGGFGRVQIGEEERRETCSVELCVFLGLVALEDDDMI